MLLLQMSLLLLDRDARNASSQRVSNHVRAKEPLHEQHAHHAEYEAEADGEARERGRRGREEGEVVQD